MLWASIGLAADSGCVVGERWASLQPTQGVLWASIGLAAVSGCVVGKLWACSRLRVCCGQALGLQPTQGVLWASAGLAASYRGGVVSTGLTCVNQVGVECRPRELTLGVSFGLAACRRGGLRSG